MCLILLSHDNHPLYRLIFAANRDEYYDRPTQPLGYWPDAPHILGGRDLKANGAWLGVTTDGRFAAITNYRDPNGTRDPAPTRGLLVSDFLSGTLAPQEYLQSVRIKARHYNGFNLLVGDGSGLFYYSNRGGGVQQLAPGVYGVSNHLIDTPWPKVQKGKAALHTLGTSGENIDLEDLFSILEDTAYPPDELLPDTGVDRDWERLLSPLFIISPTYGTRSSSVVLITRDQEVTFAERTFNPGGRSPAKDETRSFSFSISPGNRAEAKRI